MGVSEAATAVEGPASVTGASTAGLISVTGSAALVSATTAEVSLFVRSRV